jgi:hypothetical protein
VADWTLYATDTPGQITPVGELWLTRERRTARWHTRTPRFGVSSGHDTRGEALAAVGMLDTVPAFILADMIGATGAGVRVILPDGTVGVAYAAESGTHGVGGHMVRAVTFTVAHLGDPVTLAHPVPLAVATLAARPWALRDGKTVYPAAQLTVRAGAPVALTPPCAECGAEPGRHHDSANCATDWL